MRIKWIEGLCPYYYKMEQTCDMCIEKKKIPCIGVGRKRPLSSSMTTREKSDKRKKAIAFFSPPNFFEEEDCAEI